MRMKTVMLTTTDNPYNPFDDYDNWYAFDFQMGYHTPEYLARVAITSSELSEADQALAIEEAIDSIVTLNVLGIYKKVTKEVEDSSYHAT